MYQRLLHTILILMPSGRLESIFDEADEFSRSQLKISSCNLMMVEFSDKCGTKAYGRDTRRVVRTYPIVPSLIVAHSHKGELSNRFHIVVVKTCTLRTVSVSISVRQGQDQLAPGCHTRGLWRVSIFAIGE